MRFPSRPCQDPTCVEPAVVIALDNVLDRIELDDPSVDWCRVRVCCQDDPCPRHPSYTFPLRLYQHSTNCNSATARNRPTVVSISMVQVSAMSITASICASCDQDGDVCSVSGIFWCSSNFRPPVRTLLIDYTAQCQLWASTLPPPTYVNGTNDQGEDIEGDEEDTGGHASEDSQDGIDGSQADGSQTPSNDQLPAEASDDETQDDVDAFSEQDEAKDDISLFSQQDEAEEDVHTFSEQEGPLTTPRQENRLPWQTPVHSPPSTPARPAKSHRTAIITSPSYWNGSPITSFVPDSVPPLSPSKFSDTSPIKLQTPRAEWPAWTLEAQSGVLDDVHSPTAECTEETEWAIADHYHAALLAQQEEDDTQAKKAEEAELDREHAKCQLDREAKQQQRALEQALQEQVAWHEQDDASAKEIEHAKLDRDEAREQLERECQAVNEQAGHDTEDLLAKDLSRIDIDQKAHGPTTPPSSPIVDDDLCDIDGEMLRMIAAVDPMPTSSPDDDWVDGLEEQLIAMVKAAEDEHAQIANGHQCDNDSDDYQPDQLMAPKPYLPSKGPIDALATKMLSPKVDSTTRQAWIDLAVQVRAQTERVRLAYDQLRSIWHPDPLPLGSQSLSYVPLGLLPPVAAHYGWTLEFDNLQPVEVYCAQACCKLGMPLAYKTDLTCSFAASHGDKTLIIAFDAAQGCILSCYTCRVVAQPCSLAGRTIAKLDFPYTSLLLSNQVAPARQIDRLHWELDRMGAALRECAAFRRLIGYP